MDRVGGKKRRREGEKEGGGDQGTSSPVHSLQLEETRGELVRSTEERKVEVQQYKAEASSARLEHEEAKKSFDSQVRSSRSTQNQKDRSSLVPS